MIAADNSVARSGPLVLAPRNREISVVRRCRSRSKTAQSLQWQGTPPLGDVSLEPHVKRPIKPRGPSQDPIPGGGWMGGCESEAWWGWSWMSRQSGHRGWNTRWIRRRGGRWMVGRLGFHGWGNRSGGMVACHGGKGKEEANNGE